MRVFRIISHHISERKESHFITIFLSTLVYNILCIFYRYYILNNASCSSSYLQMHISISTIQPMLNRWVDPLGVDDPSLELRLWQIITSWPPFKAALLLASLAFIYYYLAFCPQRMTMTSIICRDINAPCRQPSTNKDRPSASLLG